MRCRRHGAKGRVQTFYLNKKNKTNGVSLFAWAVFVDGVLPRTPEQFSFSEVMLRTSLAAVFVAEVMPRTTFLISKRKAK